MKSGFGKKLAVPMVLAGTLAGADIASAGDCADREGEGLRVYEGDHSTVTIGGEARRTRVTFFVFRKPLDHRT